MTIRSVYIDATGIHAPTYSDVYSDLVAEYQSIFGADVYLGSDSQDGQLLGVYALALTNANNQAVAVYNSFSPATAQGAGLSSNVKLNGMARLIPSNSTAVLTLVGQAGTQINNGIVADTYGNNWALPASVSIGLSGSVSVTATCQTIGAINAQAGAISDIQTPTRGWQSATNPAAATAGNPVETDAELRIRQTISTELPSQSIKDGIVGSILNLPSVTACVGYDNDTGGVDVNGIPPNSLSIVVAGGDSAAIANAIAVKKTPGTRTYGTTSVQVTDSQGMPNTINFFVPQQIPISVTVTIRALNGYLSSTAAEIQQAVSDYINQLTIGEDVYVTRLYVPANLNGVEPISNTFDILTLLISSGGSSGGPTSAAFTWADPANASLTGWHAGSWQLSGTSGGGGSTNNIAIAFNQIATCTPASVVVVLG